MPTRSDGTPGGKRAGQGKPTDFRSAENERRQSALKIQRLLESVSEERWQEILNVLAEKAADGDMQAAKLLLEHGKGRAATQAPVETDTTINLIALDVPRPGTERYKLLCGKCKLALGHKRRE